MNMKLSEVIFRSNVLANLADKRLPYKLSYAISKNLSKFQDEMKLINEGKNRIVEEYALKDEDGRIKTKDDKYDFGDNKEVAESEYQSYMETETEVNILTVPMSVLEIEDSRFDVLTVAQVVALDFMME